MKNFMIGLLIFSSISNFMDSVEAAECVTSDGQKVSITKNTDRSIVGHSISMSWVRVALSRPVSVSGDSLFYGFSKNTDDLKISVSSQSGLGILQFSDKIVNISCTGEFPID
ncbi:MAG: hypothetical protein JST80_13020 [Bdellovibrionales bacterium]|nr:hypothetical protein [Bdellovibrionales bacterium]